MHCLTRRLSWQALPKAYRQGYTCQEPSTPHKDGRNGQLVGFGRMERLRWRQPRSMENHLSLLYGGGQLQDCVPSREEEVKRIEGAQFRYIAVREL